ncbi:hypothetical protein EVAR_60074_1 [Eumeta japonica]|uniref:Mariner Mos1 transposase n=1 Tax=Eumeta variegata TaxID=151549 RepID=A0A4C1ZL72_EUMVA|nr:hypothetical protein EVAR_60074_1 [Eumeta japonica]
MEASFFGMTAQRATIVLEDKENTAIADRKIPLHHDNASPHTARQITNCFGMLDVGILADPPYSLDLAPCDSYLCSKKSSRKVIYGRRGSSAAYE